jgi:TonB family protein
LLGRGQAYRTGQSRLYAGGELRRLPVFNIENDGTVIEMTVLETRDLRAPVRATAEGRVIVRVEVSAEGRPLSTAIAIRSGLGVLDQAALRAVKSWRFQPRTIAGIPAPGTVEVPVNFSLNR